MCSKTVDSVVRDRSCVQKLRARAVPDAKEHGNTGNDGTLKITRARWPLGREDASVLTVTKEPCSRAALLHHDRVEVDS